MHQFFFVFLLFLSLLLSFIFVTMYTFCFSFCHKLHPQFYPNLRNSTHKLTYNTTRVYGRLFTCRYMQIHVTHRHTSTHINLQRDTINIYQCLFVHIFIRSHNYKIINKYATSCESLRL